MDLLFKNIPEKRKKGQINSSTNRVLRGGNWNNNANNLRCSKRNNNNPNNTNNNNGFRCTNTHIARVCKRDFTERVLLSPDFFLLERANKVEKENQ